MYEINLNRGLGQIHFGMHPSEVKAILGNNLYYEEWMGGNLENFLFYKGLLIGFSGPCKNEPSEEAKVCMFQVKTSHELTLYQKTITNYTPKEAEKILASINLEYEYLSKSIISANNSMLQFFFNDKEVLESVYFSNKNS